MVHEFDYLREMLFLCINPVTWGLAWVLTRKGSNLSTVLFGASACQIFSITLPYLVIGTTAVLFSVPSALLMLLLSLSTGFSIGFLIYGMFSAKPSYRELRSQ